MMINELICCLIEKRWLNVDLSGSETFFCLLVWILPSVGQSWTYCLHDNGGVPPCRRPLTPASGGHPAPETGQGGSPCGWAGRSLQPWRRMRGGEEEGEAEDRNGGEKRKRTIRRRKEGGEERGEEIKNIRGESEWEGSKRGDEMKKQAEEGCTKRQKHEKGKWKRRRKKRKRL